MYQLKPGLTPDPHQVIARDFILSRPNGGAAAWLEPGLGKSFVGTECLIDWLNRGFKRILICPPAGLTEDWRMKLERYAGIESRMWDETEEHGDGIYIISHTLLQLQKKTVKKKRKDRVSAIIDWCPEVIVVDEAHRFKSYKAAQTKGLLRITDKCKPERRLALTGTPTTTCDPEELRPQLLFVDSDLMEKHGIDNWLRFRTRFCDIRFDSFGSLTVETVTGVKNKPQLDQILKQVALKQTEAVLGPMPYRMHETYYRLSPRAAKYYQTMAKTGAILTKSLEVTSDNPLVKGIRCAEIRSGFVTDIDGKQNVLDSALIDTVVERIKDTPKPLLLVYTFTFTGDRLIEALRSHYRVGVIRGGVSPTKKTEIEQAFQNGELDIVVGQCNAISLGLTFTRGKHIIYAEPTFSLEAWEQSLRRIRRRGQTHECVYDRLIEPSTLDAANYKALDNKQDFAELITRGVVRL